MVLATIKQRDEKEDIIKIVKLSYISAFLKNEKPINLMLIAPAENGKTHFLMSFFSRFSKIVSDLSFMGLIHLLQNDKNLKCLVIPDFLKITGKKQSTKQNLLTILNAYLEEGIFEISLGNKDKINLKGRTGGIITATTKESFKQNRRAWEGMGFSSRFIICSYSYSTATINKILRILARDSKKKTKSKKLIYPIKEITATEEINLKLMEFSKNSLRMFQMLMVLAKANALDRGADKVSDEDIEEIKKLSKFFNYTYTEI